MPYPSPPVTEDGRSDAPDAEQNHTKNIDDIEIELSDDGRPLNRTYQFHNCQTVYMNAFNAHGVKVKNSGNQTPKITCTPCPLFDISISVLMKFVRISFRQQYFESGIVFQITTVRSECCSSLQDTGIKSKQL